MVRMDSSEEKEMITTKMNGMMQAEQGKDNVHDGLCARADGIETVIFLFHQAAPP